MNEVMKVLTVIATIFIPLTFIVGIYGMNFIYMPELEWKYGYPTIMGLMFIIAVSLIIFFKGKIGYKFLRVDKTGGTSFYERFFAAGILRK